MCILPFKCFYANEISFRISFKGVLKSKGAILVFITGCGREGMGEEEAVAALSLVASACHRNLSTENNRPVPTTDATALLGSGFEGG